MFECTRVLEKAFSFANADDSMMTVRTPAFSFKPRVYLSLFSSCLAFFRAMSEMSARIVGKSIEKGESRTDFAQ